jgi:hypothetical protein
MLEPFLVNPPSRRLVVFNPRRKKKHIRRQRRKLKAHHKGVEVKTMSRRRHHKRNPVVLGRNPRRRHHRRNPVVLGRNPRRRHHYRRNPGIPGLKALPLPTIKQFLSLGLGAVASGLAVPVVFRFVTPLGANPIGRVATRLGVIALIGFASKKFMRAQSNDIIAGATVAQIFPIVNEALGFFKLPMRLGYSEEDEMALGIYTAEEMAQGDESGAPAIGYDGNDVMETDEDTDSAVSLSVG